MINGECMYVCMYVCHSYTMPTTEYCEYMRQQSINDKVQSESLLIIVECSQIGMVQLACTMATTIAHNG